MTANPKLLQYITLGIAALALIVAIVGCFIPNAEHTPSEPNVTAVIIDKVGYDVTVYVESDHNGTLEVWCNGHYAATISYTSGNRVYGATMQSFTFNYRVTDLEIRY